MLNLLKGQILGKIRCRPSSHSQQLGSYRQFLNDGLVTLDRRALEREHGVFALRRDAISEDRKRFEMRT